MNIAIINVHGDTRASIGNIPCPDGMVNVIPYRKEDQHIYDRISKVPNYRVEKCKNPVGMYDAKGFVVQPPGVAKPKATSKGAQKKPESERAE